MSRRRPPTLLVERLLLVTLAIASLGHLLLDHVLPNRINQAVRRIFGDTVTVGRWQLALPLRLVLVDVRATNPLWGSVTSARRIVLVPEWLSWRTRRVRLASLTIEEPHVVLRRRRDGVVGLPRLAWTGASLREAPAPSDSMTATPTAPSRPPWRVEIQTVQLVNGTVDFIDETLSPPFRAALAPLLMSVGPVAIPDDAAAMSVAVHSEVLTAEHPSAALFCSGWVSPGTRDGDVSCQLESLQLAAFEPYYHQGNMQIRAYDATMKATCRIAAASNALDGRLRIELDHLNEADISFSGRTLLDIKRLPPSTERRLSAQVQVSGPADKPNEWRAQMAVGHDVFDRVIKPFDRNMGNIKLRLGSLTIPVSLISATAGDMSSMEAASETVKENLKIIAPSMPMEIGPGSEGSAVTLPDADAAGQLVPEGPLEPPAPTGQAPEAQVTPADRSASPSP